MTLTMYDEFCGIGGTSRGASFVPGLEVTDAANHDPDACEQHGLNFPNVRHYQADVNKLDMTRMPRRDIFGASPACPGWSTATGEKREFDKKNAETVDRHDDEDTDDAERAMREKHARERLLMNEIITYLRAMIERNPNRPVLAGVVENVIQVRLWAYWDRWVGELRKLGYIVYLIPFNSMHARPVLAPFVPQSRNRCFIAYIHKSVRRTPDFNKWLLRPLAYCPRCTENVHAIQVFKKPGQDMGAYGTQYVYRCPRKTCRDIEVFPAVVPALAAIDPTHPGIRIGDRAKLGMRPLADATAGRIRAGMRRHWGPLLTPVGGTWRGNGDKGATPMSLPAPARTTRETDGVAVPPLLVPVEGRNGKFASPATMQARTQTCRAETGLMVAPFIAPLRGGGDKLASVSTLKPARTVTASGNHHGLALPPSFLMRNNGSKGDGGEMCTPVDEPGRTITTHGHQSLVTWASQLLVPYYGSTEAAQRASEPVGTLTTRARYGLARADSPDEADLPDLDDVEFRMLEPEEIGSLMGFDKAFRNEAKSKRTRVKLYGNAVTPAVAELLYSALVEAITGEELPRYAHSLAA